MQTLQLIQVMQILQIIQVLQVMPVMQIPPVIQLMRLEIPVGNISQDLMFVLVMQFVIGGH